MSISTLSRLTPSWFSAIWIASSTVCPWASMLVDILLSLTIRQPLLPDRKHVVRQPVEDQACGEVHEHHREHDGHDHHDALLLWVHRTGCHLLLNDHGRSHQERHDRNARRLDEG